MATESLFTVVIPTYNRAAMLPRAIASVLDQSFADFELLIVDDGSTDSTVDAVRAIADPRITLHSIANRGVCGARNEGARRGAGKWLTFLDSDDLALPGWLETLAGLTTGTPEPGIVFCGCLRVPEGRPVSEGRPVLPRPHPCELRARHLLLPGTFAVQRQPFLEAGGYEERLRYAEHSELRLRVLPWLLDRGWPVRVADEALVAWHQPVAAQVASRHPVAHRLAAAELMLERHGALLRRCTPRGYANSAAIAGICSAQLGDWRMARRRLFDAVTVYPKRIRNHGRLLLTLLPPIARLFWRRLPADDPAS